MLCNGMVVVVLSSHMYARDKINPRSAVEIGCLKRVRVDTNVRCTR